MKNKTEDKSREMEAVYGLPPVVFRPSSNGVSFSVKVVPRATRSQIEGWHGDALKVRLQSPPVEGKANVALIALLAERLRIGKGQVLCGAPRATQDKWKLSVE